LAYGAVLYEFHELPCYFEKSLNTTYFLIGLVLVQVAQLVSASFSPSVILSLPVSQMPNARVTDAKRKAWEKMAETQDGIALAGSVNTLNCTLLLPLHVLIFFPFFSPSAG
jgi:hypothetical protein